MESSQTPQPQKSSWSSHSPARGQVSQVCPSVISNVRTIVIISSLVIFLSSLSIFVLSLYCDYIIALKKVFVNTFLKLFRDFFQSLLQCPCCCCRSQLPTLLLHTLLQDRSIQPLAERSCHLHTLRRSQVFHCVQVHGRMR